MDAWISMKMVHASNAMRATGPIEMMENSSVLMYVLQTYTSTSETTGACHAILSAKTVLLH